MSSFPKKASNALSIQKTKIANLHERLVLAGRRQYWSRRKNTHMHVYGSPSTAHVLPEECELSF